MSMLPSFKAALDNSLTAAQCDDVVAEIKKIKGVVSAAFAEAAADDARHVRVSFYFTLHSVNNSVADRVSKIPGVKEITPVL